jgi:hypothetical protein
MRTDRAYLPAVAERWLRPADQLDYVIRRWMIPAASEESRSVAPTRLLRRSLLKRSRKLS